MTTVDDVINYASSLAGLTADPSRPECRAAYLALIAPGETPQRAADMATASGCALVCRGILRRFIVHPILEQPYVTGHAMSDLTKIAFEAHAIVPPWAPPASGYIVIVGGGSDGGGPEHAWTLLDDSGEGVDGGQRDAKGFESVALRSHVVSGGWDRTDTYRRVRWVIDVMACVTAFGRSDVEIDGNG